MTDDRRLLAALKALVLVAGDETSGVIQRVLSHQWVDARDRKAVAELRRAVRAAENIIKEHETQWRSSPDTLFRRAGTPGDQPGEGESFVISNEGLGIGRVMDDDSIRLRPQTPPPAEGEVSHVADCDCDDCVRWRKSLKRYYIPAGTRIFRTKHDGWPCMGWDELVSTKPALHNSAMIRQSVGGEKYYVFSLPPEADPWKQFAVLEGDMARLLLRPVS